MRLYSIFDRKLKEYGQVVQMNNDEAVKRSLRDGLRGTKSLVEKYPDDFDLYVLGEMDLESGVITPCAPMLVENISSIVSPAEEVSSEDR